MMNQILLGIVIVLLSLSNNALFAQDHDRAIANTSPDNLEKMEECPKNQILKFSDSKSDCFSKTVFYNMNAIQDRLAIDDVGQISFFLNRIGGSLNRIAVIAQPEICPVSQALSFRAAIWGDLIPKSSAIKLCEKSSKSTDSNCTCEDISDIANKRSREEFYQFEIDYLLAYMKKNNISEKGLNHYVRGTNLNKYKPDLVASIYSKFNNSKIQSKEVDNAEFLNNSQEENKKLAKELAELKEQSLSKIELVTPHKVVNEDNTLIGGSDRYAAFSLPSFLNEVKKHPIKTCTINYSKIDNENLNYYLYDKVISQFVQTDLNTVFTDTYQNLNGLSVAITKQQCNLIFLKSIDTVNLTNSLQTFGFKVSLLSEKNTQDLLDAFRKSTGFKDYAALKKDEEEKRAALKKEEEEKKKAEADKKAAERAEILKKANAEILKLQEILAAKDRRELNDIRKNAPSSTSYIEFERPSKCTLVLKSTRYSDGTTFYSEGTYFFQEMNGVKLGLTNSIDLGPDAYLRNIYSKKYLLGLMGKSRNAIYITDWIKTNWGGKPPSNKWLQNLWIQFDNINDANELKNAYQNVIKECSRN
jgi:hypothetical protein